MEEKYYARNPKELTQSVILQSDFVAWCKIQTCRYQTFFTKYAGQHNVQIRLKREPSI